VYYWKQGETIYVAKSVDSMKVTRATVTDLEQKVLYNLRVLAYSRAGTGLFSSPTLQFVVGEKCLTTEGGCGNQGHSMWSDRGIH